jgi:hypothetical protein
MWSMRGRGHAFPEIDILESAGKRPVHFGAMRSAPIVALAALTVLSAIAACGGGVNSEEDARKAYLGLDTSVDKAIGLGFAGFNAPLNGANISDQTADGGVSGTMTITGRVDQGNSGTSKIMTLADALSNYSDDGNVTYNTDSGALPVVSMSLKGIPTGTLDGSLNGSFMMSGQLSGQVSLALTFHGDLEPGADGGVQRKVGTTKITGTATSPAGTYNVDVTR